MIDQVRLERLLGGPELAWLVRRARARLERGEPIDGAALLADPSDAQREAVARLLGRRRSTGAALRVPLPEVEAVLRRAGLADGLAAAVIALGGPLADRRAERAAADASWASVFAVADHPARSRPVLAAWRDDLRATGALRRAAKGDAARAAGLLRGAVAVLERLPAQPVPRSVLAAEVLGDGHGLDEGRPVAGLVLRAARLLGGVPDGSGAEWRREVWASVGVLVSDLTAPVLTLSLPGDARTATGGALAVLGQAGQPVHLSLRQLVRDPPALALRGRDVFVCENPTVVAAAADALGRGCAPLVCVNGNPTAAPLALLRLLAAAGARLRYHGDFDWAGLAIAGAVIARFGAQPWRFTAPDYRAGLPRGGGPLGGSPTASPWDPALCAAMRQHRRRIEEEQILGDLLSDLAR